VAVARDTETEFEKLPPFGVIVGVATLAVIGALTVSENVVVFVTLPPLALTVTVEVRAGVAVLVLMVRVEEQVGLQLGEEKEAAAPVGSPETEKVTDCVLPATKLAEIRLVTEAPAVTELFPEFAREKSNG
jgi:hypothetical protein